MIRPCVTLSLTIENGTDANEINQYFILDLADLGKIA